MRRYCKFSYKPTYGQKQVGEGEIIDAVYNSKADGTAFVIQVQTEYGDDYYTVVLIKYCTPIKKLSKKK